MLSLAFSALSLTAGTQHGRQLSYAAILNYQPGSQVTDHANIDLDQKALESELKSGDFAGAKAIYTDGAHSKPTATCALVSPASVTTAIAKKASVTFTTNNGDATTGKAYASYSAGATSVAFTYHVSDAQVQNPTTTCYVGGLPTADQKTDGCIAVTSGSGATAGQSTFTIGAVTYTATCVNTGKRTLQGFSTKAKAVMYDCPVDTAVSYANGCPYTSYLPYYTYFGDYAYADTIVTAALDKTNGASGFLNGGVDFTNAVDVARVEYVKKGTAYMSDWMYTIREFEDAIDDCTTGDLTANALSSGPVHAWDEGVGFYTGSLMTYDSLLAGNLASLDKQGKMPYTLANKRCKNYKTCGPAGDSTVGEANVNHELTRLFRDGQHELLVGNCAKVVYYKNEIVKQMTIPLIQGTLRYAYKMAALGGADKEKAEGGIFAAAVLPQVHACSPTAAATINANMNLNSAGPVDYNAVKAAFEQCYPAMGVNCVQVGGLLKSEADGYYNDLGFNAAPCLDPSPPSAPPVAPFPDVAPASGLSTGALIGIIVACVVAVLLLLCICYMYQKEKQGKPIFTSISKVQSTGPAQ